MTTRRSRLVAGLGSLLLAATGLVAMVPEGSASAAPVTIQLLTINDFHGRIDGNTTRWATTIEQQRLLNPNTLLVGAGDLIGASLFASAVAQDQPTIDVLNALELDVSAVGNHEFDKGWADLRDRVIGTGPNAQWDYLAANVTEGGVPVLEPYEIYPVGGLDVAVIGAVTLETPTHRVAGRHRRPELHRSRAGGERVRRAAVRRQPRERRGRRDRRVVPRGRTARRAGDARPKPGCGPGVRRDRDPDVGRRRRNRHRAHAQGLRLRGPDPRCDGSDHRDPADHPDR